MTPMQDKTNRKVGVVPDQDKPNILREAENTLDMDADSADLAVAGADAFCAAKDPDWWAGRRE